MSVDILFVNPSYNGHEERFLSVKKRIEPHIPNQETPHIGIAYLISYAIKHGINAKYIDMIAEEYSIDSLMDIIAKDSPRVIGFTAFTEQIKIAGYFGSIIREKYPNIWIFAGGPHVTAIAKESLEEFESFDFVVSGEGESLLLSIVEATKIEDLDNVHGVLTRYNNKKHMLFYHNDIEHLPFPEWSKFNLSKYGGMYPHRTNRELPMITSRGCPFKCVFCCRSLGDIQRRRTIRSVINEIIYNIDNYGCESIAFCDETFILNINWFKEFSSEMKRLGLNKKISWSCSTRTRGMTPELATEMKSAGCYYIFFGTESADDNTLKIIKKNTTVEESKYAVKVVKNVGIVPATPFIIGLPGETEESVYKAIELGQELEPYTITFPIATPFPGTELREMALRNEYGMRILSNDWLMYGKQKRPVLDSEDFPADKRVEMQHIAYSNFPKKKMENYITSLKSI